MTKAPPPTRHIISINDLTNKEIETIFEVAQGFLKELADENISYRIGRGTDLASKSILASLFYEPSTRTRLSFESAMLRLGGANITSADPAVSSAAKGESLADTIRVIANYADIVVIRHPRDGAARLAAEYSQIPVINGGDGSHEHPTQTLCDLFTLRSKKKSLKNMKVAISGDLKGSRTIHSFVYALAPVRRHHRSPARARHGTAGPCRSPAARGISLPHGVEGSRTAAGRLDRRALRHRRPAAPAVAHSRSRNRLRASGAEENRRGLCHALPEGALDREGAAYPKIDAKFLGEAKYSEASVMHPLPRVNELDASFDSDRRAVYFQQAAYGVPIRMALISLLLHLHKTKSLDRFAGGFAKPDHPVYAQPIGTGLQCDNPNCITGDPAERQYAANKFYVVEEESPRSTAGCAAFIARRTSSEGSDARIRRRPIRRERHLRPAWRRWRARPPTSSSISSSYADEADAVAADLRRATARKKARAG